MSNLDRLPHYHVMTLSIEQQATLRYLMWNYLNLKLMIIFKRLQVRNTIEEVYDGSSMAVKYTKQFDFLVSNLAHFDNMNIKKNPKAGYFFSEENMRIIQTAAEYYDGGLAEKALDTRDFGTVSRSILSLLDLIDNSSKFSYSNTEIQEERRRK